MCEENKKEKELEEKYDYLLTYFVIEELILEGCRRTMTQRNQANQTKVIVHSIKVLVV